MRAVDENNINEYHLISRPKNWEHFASSKNQHPYLQSDERLLKEEFGTKARAYKHNLGWTAFNL